MLGLGVAGVAYGVDRRRTVPTVGRERLVASHLPERAETVSH